MGTHLPFALVTITVSVPLCTVAGTDPDGDGYGFEFGASCLVPGSAPAARGIDCRVVKARAKTPPAGLQLER